MGHIFLKANTDLNSPRSASTLYPSPNIKLEIDEKNGSYFLKVNFKTDAQITMNDTYGNIYLRKEERDGKRVGYLEITADALVEFTSLILNSEKVKISKSETQKLLAGIILSSGIFVDEEVESQ